MTPATLPILTYHAFETDGAVTSTDPIWFVETIDRLLDAGFRAIDLGTWIAQGRPDLKSSFALTFDDGLRSILKVADQLVSRLVPATIFLLGSRIGGDNAWPGQRRNLPRVALLDRSEIQHLAASGFRFGSHGLDHARFDQLDPSAIERELIDSRESIEQVSGQPCGLLAYPYGRSSPGVRFAARRAYPAALGTRLDYASDRDDLYNLPRIDAYYLRNERSLGLMIANRWRRRLALRRVMRTARRYVAM